MEGFDFLQPETVDAALLALTDGAKPIAGGTDLLPGWRRGKPEPARVVDLSRLDELRTIEIRGGRLWVGALCTHEQIARDELVLQHAPVLAKACAWVGSRQTRERGTLGGNLANASPAADTAPALLVLDANLLLRSVNGERTISFDHFLTSPGKTCLADNELIIGATFALPDRVGGMEFLKLGRRKGMSISVASAAVAVVVNAGQITLVRAAMGSVAPTAIRCKKVEEALLHQAPTLEVLYDAAGMVAEDISPITDVRASAEYRLRAAMAIMERALTVTCRQSKEYDV